MKSARLAVALVLVGSTGGYVIAGGPCAVNGLGQPMKWNTAGNVIYNPDQGTLGLLTNAEAKVLVAEAFAEWAAGPSNINFAAGATLAQDVNAIGTPSTNLAHYQHFYRKDGDGKSPVIFDTDGSIIDAYFGEGARFEIIGIAGLDTPVGVATTITEASIIINGAFFDGVGLPASPEDLTRTGLKAAIVHEIGHFINLDHTVLNHELAFDGNPGNDIYVPTMFPIAVDDEDALATTNPDDELAALNLYPAGAPTNAISGSIAASGGTPFRGANVVLRKIDDPLMTSYSLISGGLWFPCNVGSTCDPCNTACDPGNPPAKGAFAANRFAAGQYKVCVEQIDTRFSNSNASFVGPLPTPAILPGPEECFDAAESGDESDDPDEVLAVTAGAATPINIVLNAIPISDPFDPNNETLGTGATLDDLPLGQDTVHSVLGHEDLDVFNVPVIAGQRVRVDIDARELGSGLDAVVGFYDASNNLVARVDDAVDPDSGGFSLDPALELIASFTGTAKLVVSSYPDTDQDGLGGSTTGGYWIRVEVATDTDGDGAPDPEDICPTTARDDADRDGVCFGADNCPTLPNPEQGVPLRIASAPIPLPNSDVTSLVLPPATSPLAENAFFLMDRTFDEAFELYMVPVTGGTPSRQHFQFGPSSDVLSFAVHPNLPNVFFRANVDPSKVELWRGSTGSAEKISATLVTGGNVIDFKISPDGLWIVYLADQNNDEQFRLFRVSLQFQGPVTLLNSPTMPAAADVTSFAIDGDSVFYISDETVDERFDLYETSLTTPGFIEQIVAPTASGGDVTTFAVANAVSPRRLVYRADSDTDEMFELFSIQDNGNPSTRRRLHTTLPAGSDVDSFKISPTFDRVVMLGNLASPLTHDRLYGTSISAGQSSEPVSFTLQPNGDVTDYAISPDGLSLAYIADQVTDGVPELFQGSVFGSVPVRVNPPLPPGRGVDYLAFGPLVWVTTRLVYRADQDTDNVFELYLGLGGGTSTRLSGPLVAGGNVSPTAAPVLTIAPNGFMRVVYMADQNTNDVVELYSTAWRPDPDADGIWDLCDNCKGAANTGQDDADGNGAGDACQACPLGTDEDADGDCGAADNCPAVANANQSDFDGDAAGDACDGDDDNDGLPDTVETDTGTYVGPTNTGSDPFDADSDDDGVSDGDEVAAGANPNLAGSTIPGIPFHPGRTIYATADLAASVFAADVDGDGDMDVLSASYGDDTIAWYMNTGTSPPSWGARGISFASNGAVSVCAADVDGDGDMDALSASNIDDTIAWYENNGIGLPSFTAHTVSTTADGAYSVFTADVDGDGDMDLLSASINDNKIAWYENNGASLPSWTARTISTAASGARSVFAADVDGDGDMDVLSASYLDDKIAWYENDGASPPSWTARTISTAADSAVSVFAADVDGDGDVDVLSASYDDDKIAWYENSGASPPAWTARTISTAADGAYSVFAADMDGDGDKDALSASINDNKISWYENNGASPPAWTARTVSTSASGARSVVAADADADGDYDIVSASEADDKIMTYENLTIHRNAAFTVHNTISSATTAAVSVDAGDIDGDGDIDTLHADGGGDTLRWFESNGASPPAWTIHTIGATPAGLEYAELSDLDRDGDLDVLLAAGTGDSVAWYESGGGAIPSWTLHTISTSQDGPRYVTAADFDGDGDLDVVASSFNDRKVSWYRSDGASPPGFTEFVISISSLTQARLGLATADLDSDGDMDIIAAVLSLGVHWYQNDGASTPGWTERVISDTVGDTTFVDVADISGDGDLDVVATRFFGFAVSWFENNGLPIPSWTTRNVTVSSNPTEVAARDMDRDGDVDIVTTLGAGGFVWLESNGTNPPAWNTRTISPAGPDISAMKPADLDSDGDLDLVIGVFSVATGHRHEWWENGGGQFSLATTSLALGSTGNGAMLPTFAIDFASNARTGDRSIELATLELLVTDSGGVSLSSEEANRLIERVRVYLDNGSSAFELGSDTLVATIEDLELSPLVIPFSKGDPRVRVAPGQSKKLFVVVETALGASAQSPNAFRLTHDTQGGSKARDAVTGALLRMQYAANVATPTITTIGDAAAPFVTSVFPPTGSVDVAAYSDVIVFMSEPVDPPTVELGVTLSIGGAKVAGSADVSDDGRIVTFDPAGPLTLGGNFTLTVSSALKDRSGVGATPFASVFEVTSSASSGTISAATLGDSSGGTVLEGANANDNSGFSAAALGNVEATMESPGISDLIVGAPNADAEAVDAGEARLVFGDPALQSSSGTVASVTYHTGAAGDFVGDTVSRAGDMDADGIPDFLIGAPRSDQSASDAGVVYLIFGDPGIRPNQVPPPPLRQLGDLAACASPTLCGVKFLGEASGDTAGASLSYAGDIDADGFDDILIGAPGADPSGRADAGKVYLIYGPLAPGTIALSSVGSTIRGLVFRGETAGDRVGTAVSQWQDRNSDGIDDLLLGAPGATALDEFGVPIATSGYVYAIQGGLLPGRLDDSSTPGVIELSRVANGAADQVAGMVFLGSEPNGEIGRSLTGAVDTDGNGTYDILLAGDGMAFAIPGDGPKIVVGSTKTGGRGTPIVGALARTLGTLNAINDFGATRYLAGDTDPLTVGPAGDLNRDGFGDFMIGAPQADGAAGANAGRAYAILGTPTPADDDLPLADIGDTIAGFVVEGAAAGDNLGASVGGGFDLNADGVDDGVIGAPFADPDPVTHVNAGETYIISPIQPDEVTLLTFQDLGGTSVRIEWPVSDLTATYNVYRGLLSAVRSGGGVRTSAMTQLACGTNTDTDVDQLPDFDDAAAPSVGDAFVYLVTARNARGESPIGTGRPARVNDAQCP